jgi:hypothetical protein
MHASGGIVKPRDSICWVLAYLETLMATELKKKRDEAKQAWEDAAVMMKKAKKSDDFTGQRKRTTRLKNSESST